MTFGRKETRGLENWQVTHQTEGFANCYGLTEVGQVVWFDWESKPYALKLENYNLTKGNLLDLPPQQIVQIGQDEALHRLMEEKRAISKVIAYLPAQLPNSNPLLHLKLVLLGLILVGLALAFMNLANPKPSRVVINSSNPIIYPTIIASSTTSSYNPIAPPSISLTTLKNFLTELNSPALPEAETMYRAIVEEGGDPALALAFFEHESGGGKAGVATVTKSIGNIRCSAGYRCYTTSGNGSFRLYATWTEGSRDWVRLLKYYRDTLKLTTLEQIIPVYAPTADKNNPPAYILGVKKRVDDLREREK
jgi:hypothetical protein